MIFMNKYLPHWFKKEDDSIVKIQTITTKIPISSKNFVDIAWILRMSQKAFSFIGEDYWKISISIPDMTIWQHPFNDFFRSFTFNQNIWGWMFNIWIIRHSYLDWIEKEIVRYLEIRTEKRLFSLKCNIDKKKIG